MKRILVLLLVVLSVFLFMSCEDDPKGGKTETVDVDAYIFDHVNDGGSSYRYEHKMIFLHYEDEDAWLWNYLSQKTMANSYVEEAYGILCDSEGGTEIGKYLTWPFDSWDVYTAEEYYDEYGDTLYCRPDGTYTFDSEGASIVDDDHVFIESSEGSALYLGGNFYFRVDCGYDFTCIEKTTLTITTNKTKVYTEWDGTWYEETPDCKFAYGEDVYFFDMPSPDLV